MFTEIKQQQLPQKNQQHGPINHIAHLRNSFNEHIRTNLKLHHNLLLEN